MQLVRHCDKHFFFVKSKPTAATKWLGVAIYAAEHLKKIVKWWNTRNCQKIFLHYNGRVLAHCVLKRAQRQRVRHMSYACLNNAARSAERECRAMKCANEWLQEQDKSKASIIARLQYIGRLLHTIKRRNERNAGRMAKDSTRLFAYGPHLLMQQPAIPFCPFSLMTLLFFMAEICSKLVKKSLAAPFPLP